MAEETLVRSVFLSMPELAPVLWAGYRQVKRPMPGLGGRLLIMGEPLDEEKLQGFERVVFVTPYKEQATKAYERRADYLELVSARTGMPVVAGLKGPLRGLTDDEFRRFVKTSIATRSWARHLLVRTGKVYELFDAMSKGPREFLPLYYQLRKSHNEHQIFSAILTFLHKVQDAGRGEREVSPYYEMLLKRGRKQIKNIVPSVEWLMTTNFQHELVYVEFYRRVMGAAV